jgi:hypothetical protein
MSRRRLAIFVTALLAAGLLVACGGDSDSGGSSGESAEAVLEEATLEGIDSGNLDASFDLEEQGEEGRLEFSLSGPFQGEGGGGSLPLLDMTAKAKSSGGDDDLDFEGGLVLLPNSAYVNYEGVEYEVDPTTFAFVESALKEALGEADADTEKACREAFSELDIADMVEDAVNEGSAEVDGVTTTKISGALDVFLAPDAILKALESPACSAQLRAGGPLPSRSEIEESEEKVRELLKDAQVEVYVGDDGIVRQISAQMTLEGKGSDSESEIVTGDLELKLSGVNEEQEIAAPEDAKPLSRLFLKLGVNPIELLGLLEGEGGGEGLGELFERLGLPGAPSGS